ncbi:FAD-dependent oxidoreductase [Paucibacter sp. XJ19-41]|uniref:FAD-dependent oxidoreductase n=1 Tax=Paucibacter sp. XJ19-41 TaxID=2927824 RepID=UPI00234A29B7|nr:FAD-dependent oxidoreductase [Paucibacter sp. XJ19-41]MDC6167265.1 FAD-dependent oxidoreductase [Paucibacter sp. XJ19-41]
MRIAVIGAGIIGVSTAYELGADGHEVTVFERSGSVAAETSFANAGIVAPGYVGPWAAPGMPAKLLRQLFASHAAARLGGPPSAATLSWLWRWWRACKPKTHATNRRRMHGLAAYSAERLRTLRQQLQLDYERADGYLVLLRSARELAAAQPGLQLLGELGVAHKLLDAAQCRAVEPGLNPDTALAGGIHLAQDEVGNCRQFTHLLRGEAQRLGVRFRFHTTVRRIEPGSAPLLVHEYTPPDEGQIVRNEAASREGPSTLPQPIEPQQERFDAIIVCAAMGSAALLRPLGLKLPLAAVHGYSITAPLRQLEAHPDLGPRAGLMDERYKVAISRIGQRVRVAGSAELGGDPAAFNAKSISTLHKVLHDWFPGATHTTQAQRWKGARPMLPDGPPVLGASGAAGVWLNLGHGSSGWALACGSARVLADQLAGRSPGVDVEGLDIGRLR